MKYTNDKINLQQKDVFEELPNFNDNFFDLCIVDLPYGASTTKSWNYNSDKKLQGFGGDWKLTSEAWNLLTQNDSFQSTYFLAKRTETSNQTDRLNLDSRNIS